MTSAIVQATARFYFRSALYTDVGVPLIKFHLSLFFQARCTMYNVSHLLEISGDRRPKSLTALKFMTVIWCNLLSYYYSMRLLVLYCITLGRTLHVFGPYVFTRHIIFNLHNSSSHRTGEVDQTFPIWFHRSFDAWPRLILENSSNRTGEVHKTFPICFLRSFGAWPRLILEICSLKTREVYQTFPIFHLRSIGAWSQLIFL